VFEGSTDAHYRYTYHSGYSGSTKVYDNEDGNIAIDDVYIYNTSCKGGIFSNGNLTVKQMECRVFQHSFVETFHNARVAQLLERIRKYLIYVAVSNPSVGSGAGPSDETV
jgi:hypothetical protein